MVVLLLYKTPYMKLITFSRSLGILAIAASAFIFTGCDKDDDVETPTEKNITETVVDNPAFSLLEIAVTRANLANTLATTENITVFAPDNDAFTAAGLTEQVLNTVPVATLEAILKNHVLGSRVPAANVPAGPNAELTALGGEKLYATANASGVYINGVKVKTADVSASNGVIHVVSRVIFPPAGNIVETAVANPDFTYLVAAVTRADASGTSISGALTAAGPLTVFAPTNQAFIEAGFPTIESIEAADANTLKNILLYHVVPARVFSSDLTEGAQPTTAGGGTVTVTLAGGAKVQGASNTTASGITATDIVANNGVIHIIDQVLLP